MRLTTHAAAASIVRRTLFRFRAQRRGRCRKFPRFALPFAALFTVHQEASKWVVSASACLHSSHTSYFSGHLWSSHFPRLVTCWNSRVMLLLRSLFTPLCYSYCGTRMTATHCLTVLLSGHWCSPLLHAYWFFKPVWHPNTKWVWRTGMALELLPHMYRHEPWQQT